MSGESEEKVFGEVLEFSPLGREISYWLFTFNNGDLAIGNKSFGCLIVLFPGQGIQKPR